MGRVVMPPIQATAEPAKAALPATPDGEQPPAAAAQSTGLKPVTVAARDERSKEEQARALLQGEPSKEAAPDESENASIDAHFDPETDELLPIGDDGSSDGKSQMEDGKSGEAEAETQGAQPAGEAEAESETGEDEEEPGEDKARGRRIRVRREALSDRDFAILTLAKDKRITFAEAEAQLFGGPESGGRRPENSETQALAQAARAEPTAAELSTKLGQLREAREQARMAMDDRKADEINDQIIEVRDHLKEVHRAEQARAQNERQTAEQRYRAAETAAITRVTEVYPDADTKGSRLNEAMQARAAEYQREHPVFFSNPKWPIALAAEVAVELGIAPRLQTGAAPAPKGGPLPVPKKITRPVISPASGHETAAVVNPEAALKARLDSARKERNLDEAKAVLRELTALASKR